MFKTLASLVSFALLLGTVAATVSRPALAQHTVGLSPEEALAKLLEGNQRFVARKAQHPDQSVTRLHEVESGQHPFAVILSCSDSRVPPDVVFDEGLGDLFVIRVAGNVTDNAVIGSIEYAVEHLGTPLVVVLGHQSCGAVQAAVKGGEEGNHIHSFVDAIKPLAEEAKKRPGDPVDTCVRLNVAHVVEQLRTSEPVLAPLCKQSKLRVVGAYYSLHTGTVSLLP
ncbi:MAG TPA: carbonic anhydrase [Terriglobia bacterium]|nr:carbonic anhydrase [Terriglobia bacterium]